MPGVQRPMQSEQFHHSPQKHNSKSRVTRSYFALYENLGQLCLICNNTEVEKGNFITFITSWAASPPIKALTGARSPAATQESFFSSAWSSSSCLAESDCAAFTSPASATSSSAFDCREQKRHLLSQLCLKQEMSGIIERKKVSIKAVHLCIWNRQLNIFVTPSLPDQSLKHGTLLKLLSNAQLFTFS